MKTEFRKKTFSKPCKFLRFLLVVILISFIIIKQFILTTKTLTIGALIITDYGNISILVKISGIITWSFNLIVFFAILGLLTSLIIRLPYLIYLNDISYGIGIYFKYIKIGSKILYIHLKGYVMMFKTDGYIQRYKA